MDRRTLLRNAGLAAMGLAVGGCASNPARVASAPVGRGLGRRARLVPVNVSWDRIIRTTVGLRPHRPTGFVVRADRMDTKTIVHNYGHGGAGHSLAWGTGELAAELALQHPSRRAAVIGCGTVGLTSALVLQRRGFDVTIYAESVPPETTSNMALAGFTPTSGLVSAARSPEWDAQFGRAVVIAYRRLQLLVGRHYGVSWIDNYTPTDRPPTGEDGEGGMLPAEVRSGDVLLQPGEHPFPTQYALVRPEIRIEPSVYLDALVSDFLLRRGRLVVRRFETARDLMSLPEPLIVNCTGLGARLLFGDEELTPLKGQLTVLVPQPEVDYSTVGRPGPDQASVPGVFSLHTMPRADGIVLGGTSERGVWSLEPNDSARTAVVEGHMALFGAMSAEGPLLTRGGMPRPAPAVGHFVHAGFRSPVVAAGH